MCGQIMYYNTRTGAQSHDLPDGHESGDSRSASSMHMSDDDEMLSDRSSESRREALQGQAALSPQGAAVSANVFNRHTSTVYIDSDGASGSAASSRLRSGSMASSMTAQSSNTATSARRNPLDSMPDPRDVRPPWKVREALDERSFFFYNTETRETRYDVPPGALISRTRDTLEELADEPRSATARVSSLPTLESEESETEGDGRPVARAPGKSPKLRRDGSRRPMSIPPAMSDAPRSMMLEAEQALALQKTLEPDSAQALSVLVETAADTISHLASVAAEAIGSDGKSEADRAVVPDPEDALSDHSRLGGATSAVVRAIRDLLYAAGTLGIPQLDLAPIAELCVQPGDEDAATGPVGAFHAALVALQQKSPSSSARDQATVQQAVSAPPGLLALSKKVNATVSKLVLSARAVVEQPMLEGGRGTELADSQIEKLSSHRQRVRDDAMDLARALGALGSEIERAKVSRGAAIPWSRRIHGVVDSGSGTAGVGLQVLGGGSAAGWRGNGFVLPTPTEAATLRAEALGTFHNPFELTKDAQQALNSGKIALRRKPREPLSRALIDERIRRQHDDLVRHLSDLALMIQHGGELPNGQTNGDAVAPDAVSRALTRASFRSVLAQVRLVLVRFGSLMNLVEDADIAAVLDVDGPSEDEPLEAQERTRLMVGITKARLALGTLANVKQAAYDHSAAMLIDVQDLSMSLPYSGADLAVSEQLLLQTRELTSVVQRQLSLLLELVDIAEAQGSQTLSHIGARSKVYGIDDVLVSTLMSDDAARVSPGRDEGARGAGDADSSYDGESAEDEVMYLGPGLAVPNGPPSSRHDVVRSAPSLSPAVPPSNKSYSTSVRGGLGMRTRSTSVTTGASVGSQESAARTMSQRRGTTDHGDDDEEHTARVKSSNKMKRFFGDDPTAASTDALSLAPSTDARAPPVPPIRQVEEIPWFLEADYAPHDIVMNASGQVKGATLGALMERLTMHNAFDPTFNNTFLMTYRSFTTTEEFLDLLFARFRVKMPPGLSPDEQQVWAEKKQTPIRLR
jgi:son of sevenless-like protein